MTGQVRLDEHSLHRLEGRRTRLQDLLLTSKWIALLFHFQRYPASLLSHSSVIGTADLMTDQSQVKSQISQVLVHENLNFYFSGELVEEMGIYRISIFPRYILIQGILGHDVVILLFGFTTKLCRLSMIPHRKSIKVVCSIDKSPKWSNSTPSLAAERQLTRQSILQKVLGLCNFTDMGSNPDRGLRWQEKIPSRASGKILWN